MNTYSLRSIMSLTLLLLSLSWVSASNQIFNHLGVQDGLSQMSILSVYQDEIGRMWFGTNEGLNEYNGKSVKVYRPTSRESALMHNEIRQVTGNKKGSLYLRAGNDLVHFDLKKQKFTRLKQNAVDYISYSNDTLWVLTNKEVLFYKEGESTLQNYMKLPEHSAFYSLFSHNNLLYLGTDKGLFELDKRNKELRRNKHITESNIKTFYLDKKANLWIGSDGSGLFLLDDKGVVKQFVHKPNDENSISNNSIRDIVEDDFGNIWIGTFLGLNKYVPNTDSWQVYNHVDGIIGSLSHNSVFALYNDMQGTIWIGTYFGGVSYFNPKNEVYNYIGANIKDPFSLSFPFVGKMTEDSKGNLWIATEGGGLNYYDLTTRQITKYQHVEGDPNTLSHNNLKSIYLDEKRNKLFVGTHRGGISVLDLNTNKFHRIKHEPGRSNSLPNNIVNEMQEFNGQLAVLTQEGLSFMDLDTEEFSIPYKNNELLSELSRTLTYETFFIDSKNRAWLAKSKGGLVRVDFDSEKIHHYEFSSSDEKSVTNFKILSIVENGDGQIFFASIGSGILEYNSKSDDFLYYTMADNHLISDYCYYIAETTYRYLLVLHNKGMSLFDPRSKHLKYSYNFSNVTFSQGSSAFISKNGEIYLGSTSGLMSFYEQQLYTLSNDFSIYFDKLFVNNKEIHPGDDSNILANSIVYCDDLVLKHKENNIIIEVAVSDYSSISNVRYEYILEGFDKQWLPLPDYKQITYTNINSGNYTLLVRSVDENNETVETTSIKIKVKSPFYATIWAYLLYALLTVAVLYYIIRFNNRQTNLKASLLYERKEKERIEELNQSKLRFFTSISHEFRTPLTLIIGQVEFMLESSKLSPTIYNRLLRVYKNSQHMRSLISELLDFRKHEQGFVKLSVNYYDIVSFTREIFMSFYEHAAKQQIKYEFDSADREYNLWFDPMQLKKVLYNIISNSFKFIQENGEIYVSVRKGTSSVYIEIKDNGVGISEEAIDRVFERFYQTENINQAHTLGTGIGLALSKSIVELHQGEITVESEPGVGTVFTIILKTGNSHFSDEDLKRGKKSNLLVDAGLTQDINTFEELIEMEEINDVEAEDFTDKPSILIVEDNDDILEMLVDVFTPIYEVYTARNGEEGLEMVDNLLPDIVLSDVMMPKMSGKEMCYRIKSNIKTSHIPVVLLTAQTSDEHRIEGYMFGADDYITKPFNIKLLVARCNNLIKSRRLLLNKLNKSKESVTLVPSINEEDQKLIEKTVKVIQENFDNSDFNMNELAREIGIGRSKLYTKIKDITGLTPNEFTLKLKLDEGHRLLTKSPNLNVSEVAYRVGFTSPRYFSKCFKSFYGVTPAEVKMGNK